MNLVLSKPVTYEILKKMLNDFVFNDFQFLKIENSIKL